MGSARRAWLAGIAAVAWAPFAMLGACSRAGSSAGASSGNPGDASAAEDSGAPRADAASARDASSADTGQDAAPDAPADTGPPDAGPLATVHFVGRFDTRDPKGPRFAWPGSAIMATFTGTGIAVQMHDAGTNYFAVVIDGGAPTVLSTSSAVDTYALASKLAPGTHTLVLTKRTESYVGVVQFFGLTPTAGNLVPSPEPFTRRIEFVGDSISCGYGVLGMGPDCNFSAATEDETVAYDALASAKLGVQQTVVAYSGIGLLRDYGGSTTNQMPVRFELALADDPTSTWGFGTPQPDVVLVHLGTNDFAPGDPGTAFQAAYVAFVKQLRGHYGAAQVVCALSPMLDDPARSQARTYIQGAVAQLTTGGDSRVSYFEFDEQLASDGYGCNYHPSPTTHQKMAAKLEPAVQTLAGW